MGRHGRGCHFNFFWGGGIFLEFFNATGLLKNWKKQHFICSNLTLFDNSLLSFFLFFPFFLFFLFFTFSFSFFPWGRRRPPMPPLKWRPWDHGNYYQYEFRQKCCISIAVRHRRHMVIIKLSKFAYIAPETLPVDRHDNITSTYSIELLY